MTVKTFAYYPGCSGSGTSVEYDKSSRAVCEALGVRLVDLPDWNCCGSTPAHQVDHVLSAALSARNLAQAETLGLCETLTPCPSCLKNLHNAVEHLREPGFGAKVDALVGRPLTREHSVKSVLQVIYEDVTPEKVAEKVTRPLDGLKLVPYYGCLMNRPGRSMHFDDEENPVALDKLMQALGAEVLPFPLKQECCGGAMGVPDNRITSRLSGKLLEYAVSLGADAFVVACPLCQMNLDMRQAQAGDYYGQGFNLPVFYYTQLMGLALGLDKTRLGLDKLIVKPAAALAKIGRKAKAEAPPASGAGRTAEAEVEA
jgi:heterodisulfide reductase subunit B